MRPHVLVHGAHDLAELLEIRALRHPARVAFTFAADDGSATTLTYGELHDSALRIAANLQLHCAPRDRVMLTFPPGLEFIQAFFGCLYAGAIPVPTSYPKPRRPMSRLEAIYDDASPGLIVSTAQVIDQSIESRERFATVRWIPLEALDVPAGDFERAAVEPTDLCWLQYTSGSTTEPKGVMISHANVLHNLEAIRRGFGLSPADSAPDEIARGVFWLPAYHDMGLIGGILMPIYVGGHSLLMAPNSFLQQPIRWLRAIADSGAQISGAPNFAYELCARKTTLEQRADLRLDRWRVAFCGAEPVRAATLAAFAETFAPCGFQDSSFYPCYGLAESTLLAVGGAGPARPHVLRTAREALGRNQLQLVAEDSPAVELVACGSPTPENDCRIVDPQTMRPVAPGCVGEIWLASPSIAQGYWRRPEASEAKFAVRLPDDTRPWLRTGDLGVLDDDRLYITGRLSDRIIVRGRNYYPQNLEATATAAHEALRTDAAAAFSITADDEERVVVALELKRTHRSPDFDEITRAVRSRLIAEEELDPASIVFLRHGHLPLTTSGKIRRNAARTMFQERSWAELHRWDRTATRDGAMNGRSQPRDAATERLYQEARARRGADATQTSHERFAEQIESWLLGWLADRLDVPSEQLDSRRPFAEYGLDSVAAVELSGAIQDCLDLKLSPVAAWDYPTPAKLARFLADEVRRNGRSVSAAATETVTTVATTVATTTATAAEHSASAAPTDATQLTSVTPAPDAVAQLLAEIENMSDADAEQALRSISGTRN